MATTTTPAAPRLSPPELAAWRGFLRAHALLVRELADALMLSRSGLTRLVDRLVRDGLIKRSTCSADARGAYAVLTPKGQRAMQAARPLHLDGVRRRFLDHFDEQELARLTDVWERLTAGEHHPAGCS